MNYKKEDVNDNLELLFLITLLYFPCQQRSNIPRIISKAFNIEDEKIQNKISAQCILIQIEFLEKGYIRKGYIDYLEKYYLTHLILTPKGFSKMLETDSNSEPFNTLLKVFSQFRINNKSS